MSDQIRADFGEIEQVTNRLSNQAQETQDMIQTIERTMEPLQSGGWQGRGSEAFYNMMEDDVLPSTKRLQQALVDTRDLTRQISEAFQDADNEAGSYFK